MFVGGCVISLLCSKMNILKMKGGLTVSCEKVDWNVVEAEYLEGGTSYRKLAKKYEIPLKTLEHRAQKEGWYKKRGQIQGKIRAKNEKDIVTKSTKKSVKINTVADNMLKRLLDITESPGFSEFTVKDIKDMAIALKGLKDVKGEKSSLDKKEQKARIKNLERQAAAGQQNDDPNTYGIAKIPAILPLEEPPIEDNNDD